MVTFKDIMRGILVFCWMNSPIEIFLSTFRLYSRLEFPAYIASFSRSRTLYFLSNRSGKFEPFSANPRSVWFHDEIVKEGRISEKFKNCLLLPISLNSQSSLSTLKKSFDFHFAEQIVFFYEKLSKNVFSNSFS